MNTSFDDFDFRRWNGNGTVRWKRPTFEQMPLQFHIVNGMANLPILEVVDAELVKFEGPGIGVAMNGQRVVEPVSTRNHFGRDTAQQFEEFDPLALRDAIFYGNGDVS